MSHLKLAQFFDSRSDGHSSFVRSVPFCIDEDSPYWPGLDLSHEDRRLIAGSDDTVRIWHLRTGEEVRLLTGHDNWVNSAAFSPDDSRILSGIGGHLEAENGRWAASFDDTVRLKYAATGSQVLRIDGYDSQLRSVAFSPGVGFALSGSDEGVVYL